MATGCRGIIAAIFRRCKTRRNRVSSTKDVVLVDGYEIRRGKKDRIMRLIG